MQQIKIAFLCGSTAWGGLELNHFKTAKYLNENGIQVLCIGIENSPFSKHSKAANLSTCEIKKYANHYAFKRAFEIKKTVQKEHVSHVFIRANNDQSIAASLKFLLPNLVVCYFMEMQLKSSKKHFFRTIRYYYISHWFCPLEYMKNQVHQFTNVESKKVKLLKSAVFIQESKLTKKEARQKYGLPEDAFILGLPGRFDQYKGHKLAIDALSNSTNKQLILAFLGQNTLTSSVDVKSQLIAYTAEKKLDSRVYFLEHDAQIEDFFQAIDWTLMASDAESIGMVTLESLFLNNPVLGSDSAGTSELIHNSNFGMLFEPKNKDELTLHMNQLGQNTLSYLGLKNADYVNQFKPSKVFEELFKHLSLSKTHV